MQIEESNTMPSEGTTGSSPIARLVSSLFVNRTNTLLIQAMRFAMVGAVATVADASVYGLLISKAHMHYMMAAVFGFILGVLVSYALSVRWVFASRTMSSKGLEFAMFGLIGVVGLALTELVLYCAVKVIGPHYMTAKAIAIVTVFFWNFGARRLLLFRS